MTGGRIHDVEALPDDPRPFFQAIFDLDTPRIVFGRVALLREGVPTLWRRVHTDGSYARVLPAEGLEPLNAQQFLLEWYSKNSVLPD